MTAFAELLNQREKSHPLMDGFLKWQCRVRQIAMRETFGRPDDAVTPNLTLAGETEPMGAVITVISKRWQHSKLPEMQHMVKHTNDPAQRRDKALQFFSSTYFQKAKEFSGVLTATFPPGSPGAAKIAEVGACELLYEAYGQQFNLVCDVSQLDNNHPAYQATWWHNKLFNPELHPDTIILAFMPDWDASTADPKML